MSPKGPPSDPLDASAWVAPPRGRGEHRPVTRTPNRSWLIAAVVVGVIAWALARFVGVGPMRGEALGLALLAAALTFGLRFIRLRSTEKAGASLSARARRNLLLLSAAAASLALAHAIAQARQGYPELTPEMVFGAESRLESGFYTASGVPLHEALYTISGHEGQRYLAPLDGYDGQLLIVTEEAPPEVEVRVTGRLRDDLRTVQRSPDGQAAGPFLPMYREHMALPDQTQIYFLDTSVRAGLNARALALVIVPAYLFLLLIGAPVRPAGPRARAGA
jgi:hypothetical protein